MLRLLQGLWVAMKISIVSILISMPLGILVGALMTVKNRFVKAIFRVYLEFIRIMPQLVLLFIVYFGSTRALGWNLSGEVASVIVFVLWGTAEMGDLVRGALISIPKHQYESSEALGFSKIQIKFGNRGLWHIQSCWWYCYNICFLKFGYDCNFTTFYFI